MRNLATDDRLDALINPCDSNQVRTIRNCYQANAENFVCITKSTTRTRLAGSAALFANSSLSVENVSWCWFATTVMFIADTRRADFRNYRIAREPSWRIIYGRLFHTPGRSFEELVRQHARFALYDRVLGLNVERIYGRFNLSVRLFFHVDRVPSG